MEAGSTSYGPVCDAVAAFEAALFEYTTNWGSYLGNAVLEAETICVRQAAAGQLDALLQSALDSELQFFAAAVRADAGRSVPDRLTRSRRSGRSWHFCPGGRPVSLTLPPPTPSA